jgi:UDP-glucose 4-epimerase
MTARVLLTGGAGYIGSQTTIALLEAGYSVVVVDDLSTGRRDVVPEGALFIEMNCADPDVADLLKSENIEAVLHFAARIKLDESIKDPLGYYESNFSNSLLLLKSVVKAEVKSVVFSSTAAVYGETGQEPVSEARLPHPATPYGRSKLATEWMLEDLSRATDIRHVALRYFNVAGADPLGRTGPRADAQHLVKLVAEAAAGRLSEITIHGDDWPTRDGTCIRDYIHVADLAQAHVAALRHLLNGGESLTLNCGYGRGFTVREVVEAGLRLARAPFAVRYGPRRPGDMASVVADAGAIQQRLNWSFHEDRLVDMLQSGMRWADTSR